MVESQTAAETQRRVRRAIAWSIAIAVLFFSAPVIFYLLREPPQNTEAIEPYEPAGPALQPVETKLPQFRFTDITAESGIQFIHTNGATGARYMPESFGGGIAVFDYNLDGHQDLLFINSRAWSETTEAEPATSRLYRGIGDGRFEDVTDSTNLGLNLYGMGAAVGDYDGDGYIDVYVTAFGRNRLLRNSQGERFIDVTEDMGVAGLDSIWSTSAAFFDYDRDGDLDLFVGNYVHWSEELDEGVNYRLTGLGRTYGPPDEFSGTDSYLFRNDGDGFTEIGEAAGIAVKSTFNNQPVGKALGVLPIDMNDDGWLDLVVANDSVRNFLFLNHAGKRFVEIGRNAGIAFDTEGRATYGMGIDAAWLNGDEELTIAIGNFANETSSFFVARGENRFSDDAIVSGIGPATLSALTFGVLFFDPNLDGHQDYLQANGHVEPEIRKVQSGQTYAQQLQLFANCGENCEVPFQLADDFFPDLRMVGRGLVYADIDGDGDQDVIVTQTGGRPVVLRNDNAAGHHFLRVKLKSASSNRYGIGATIWLVGPEVHERRQVMAARSYLSQVELPVTVGLGKQTVIDHIKVRWPTGEEEVFAVSDIDQTVELEQGTGSPVTD